MSTRTFDDIQADAVRANSNQDADALMNLATELEAVQTPQAEAAASRSRGWAFSCRGNYSAALLHYHRALALYEELGDRSGMAGTTCSIGIVHGFTGEYPAALEHYYRALAICEEIGHRHFAANITGNIGGVYYTIDDYPAALSHFHRALELLEELDDRRGVATVTGNIGSLHDRTGNYPEALNHHHRALALHEQLGDRSGVARVTGNIGSLHNNTGNYPEALYHLHRALALHDELGDRSVVAHIPGNILSAYVKMGSDAEARQLLATMDTMHIDDPGVRIQREQNRATLQERSGDLDGAAVTLQRALGEALEHGLRSHVAETHKALRDLAQRRNDFAAYIEHNNEFTRVTEEINGKESTLKMAMQAKQREIDAERREHEKQIAVLHSTLPKHIADRVARGETVNDSFDNAAVIFLDIVGFTSISDRIPSGHVVHLLEQIFTTLDTVCKRNDVVKIKTIGDSYMAVSFESVANAATCALDMIASLDALEITMPPSLGDTSWTKDVGDIKVRIGIHCGAITAGVIGTDRMQYDVWGDTVNVASRMESTGEAGRVHVSAAFAANLQSNTEYRIQNLISESDNQESHEVNSSLVTSHSSLVTIERGSMDIKGKGPMTTYWLEAP